MIFYFLIPLVILCIFFYIYKNYKIKKNVFAKISKLAELNNYNITKSNDKISDFILENDNDIIFIKYINIPKNSSITVNSKSTWCLRYGGGSREGRSYPNKEYLTDLTPFLNKEYNCNKKVRKVTLIYPSTEKLLKYINESEIITLKQSDIVYGTQIILFCNIDEFLFESTPHSHCF